MPASTLDQPDCELIQGEAVLGTGPPVRYTTIEATFAFVDLAGFTALTETHGDDEAVATVRSFQDRVRRMLQPGDELVKTIGDAVMLKFSTPLGAVKSLREIVESEMSRDDSVLLPRTGAHHGTAVAVDGDYYGAAVNLAARIAGEAAGGQLLVSQQIAEAAIDLGAATTHLGCRSLRNVATPVDIFDIRVSDTAITVDPVCHMRVSVDLGCPLLTWQGHEIRFCGLPCLAQFAMNPERYLAGAPAWTDDA